jgi:hypothetical protein
VEDSVVKWPAATGSETVDNDQDYSIERNRRFQVSTQYQLEEKPISFALHEGEHVKSFERSSVFPQSSRICGSNVAECSTAWK